MEDRIKIAAFLDSVVSSLNISEFRKLQAVHENGWKEYLNGSLSSQMTADKNKEAVIVELVNGLDQTRIDFIAKVFM